MSRRLLLIGLDREMRVETQKESNTRVAELIEDLRTYGRTHTNAGKRGNSFFSDALLARVHELQTISDIRLKTIAEDYVQKQSRAGCTARKNVLK